jgi:hypothetical protein
VTHIATSENMSRTHAAFTIDEEPDRPEVPLKTIYFGFDRLVDWFILSGLFRFFNREGQPNSQLVVSKQDFDEGEYADLTGEPNEP